MAQKATMRKAVTSDATREDVEVVLADLFRHLAMKAQGDPNAKLPTRLRKLEGVDDLDPNAAAALGNAGSTAAQLVLAALDRAGYALVEK